MSESLGPETRKAIAKMGVNLDQNKKWGVRAVALFPLGMLGLFFVTLFLVALVGNRFKGWDGLWLFAPLFFGVPLCTVVGLVLAGVGCAVDGNKTPALIGLVLWGALALAMLLFAASK